MARNRTVVFSDLDGTLLDHDTYDWQPAAPAIAALKRRRVPLVLVSSKTLSELARLRRAMALEDPVVAENGAVIDVPRGYFRRAAPMPEPPTDREAIQRVYRSVRAAGNYDCKAFFELGDDGIVAATGLTPADARRANRRDASEPVLWLDSEERLAAFREAIAGHGLRTVRGGRFVHLMGRTDKGDAVRRLLAAYEQENPGIALTSVALGDGPNDLGMLRAADIAVVIRAPHGQPMPLADHPRVLRPDEPGPAGWAAAMLGLLAEADGIRPSTLHSGFEV